MCSKKITSINIKRKEGRKEGMKILVYQHILWRFAPAPTPLQFFGEKNEMKFAYVKGVSLANSINATTRE